MDLTSLYILIGTAILCAIILLANKFSKEDPVLAQWMRYVGKAAPLILGSIPNFPSELIPVVIGAINEAEQAYGTDEGAAKKAYVVNAAARANAPQTYAVPELQKAIDTIIQMVNHASKISQQLDNGSLTPPTKPQA